MPKKKKDPTLFLLPLPPNAVLPRTIMNSTMREVCGARDWAPPVREGADDHKQYKSLQSFGPISRL